MCIIKTVSSYDCVKNHEHTHGRAKWFHILIYGMNIQLTTS